MPDEREFRQQIIILVIGALLGLVPSLIIVTYQSRQQQKQFLLDRRLAALREFSTALTGEGDLLAKYDELEIVTGRLIRFPNSSDVEQDFVRSATDTLLLEQRYTARMQTAVLVMTSTFGVRFPAPKFTASIRSDIRSMSKQERISMCKELLRNTADLRDEKVKLISDYETLLNKVAAQIQ